MALQLPKHNRNGLSEVDLNIVILEARDRIGGRVFTLIEPSLPGPVELGAEFIHGKPDVLLAGIYKSGLAIHETSGDSWICGSHGPKQADDVEKAWDGISKEMLRTNGADRSFESFLVSSKASASDKQLARKYVEGFHAADPGRVSVHSLAIEKETSDRIKGNRLFRLKTGYAALMQWYASNSCGPIRVNAQVRKNPVEQG